MSYEVPFKVRLPQSLAIQRERLGAARLRPQDIGDEFELERKRADTTWLEDGVWSEYVDFPRNREKAENREKADARISGLFFRGRATTEKVQCHRAVPLNARGCVSQRRELGPNCNTAYPRAAGGDNGRESSAGGATSNGTVSDVHPFREPVAGKLRSALVLSGSWHSTHYIPEDIEESICISGGHGKKIIRAEDVDDNCSRVLSMKQASAAAKTCYWRLRRAGDFDHFPDGVVYAAPLILVPCKAKIPQGETLLRITPHNDCLSWC
ncbi:hypothetical protein FB45DRAFT_876033 [Roridomyces roridus]|uniref:Uncharacterized protein n=1 Tax=Roridomyces roridus TaxID=1738132 RepID=A0AAD7B5H6_9AGAR|nr:hypothetical protein FB45DRAFT_876033 [Roridomyces roridus]